MKKTAFFKRTAVILTIISILGVIISGAAMTAGFSVWDGVSVTSDWASNYDTNSVFEINSAADFMAFRNKVISGGYSFSSKTVELNCDIDLNYHNLRYGIGGWLDLSGKWYSTSVFFKGTFNGNEHIVKNIKMDQTMPDALLGTTDANGAVGLFTARSASINHLGVENISITLPNSVTVNCYYGGLASVSYETPISDCYVKNASFSGGSSDRKNVMIGGVSGYHRDRAMTNTYIDGCDFSGLASEIMGYSFIGGIACSGDSNTTIEKCYSANIIKNASQQGRYDNAIFILNPQNNGSSFIITLNNIYTDVPRHQSDGSYGNTGLLSDAAGNLNGTLGNAFQDMSGRNMFPILAWEDPPTENKAGAVSKYTNQRARGWEISNPFPLSGFTLPETNYFAYLNDGSSSYPSEAYLELNDLSNGTVTFNISFTADRLMNDLSFRLLDGREKIFGIITDNAGKMYLEGTDGNIQLCSYTANTAHLINATVDLSESIVKKIQIDGITCESAANKPFITKNASADAFSIKTGVEAQGIVTINSFYADMNYYVLDEFLNFNSRIPDDWQTTGNVTLHTRNSTTYNKNDLCLAQSSGITKTFDAVKGNLTFEMNVLQPAKGGNFSVNLWGGNNKVLGINSDGTYLFSDLTGSERQNFAENIYNHIRLDIRTGTRTADAYFNSRCIKRDIPFDGDGYYIDKITVTTESGCQDLYVDDIKLYDTAAYASDYPATPIIPAKPSGSPLISMQVCPMWTQGQHFGWDYINQASDKRKPVLGFYNDSNTEAADWSIKYMAEHGVDFINFCVFPELPNDESSQLSPMTDTSVRNIGFLNAYLNSRYNDKIKFAVFFEANGLDDMGSAYYDDFFDVVLPKYIEVYFKHPQYQKVNGRPVFGIYSFDTFANMLDTGNTAQGRNKETRIKNGIQKIRDMCTAAGVGNPYLVEHQSYKYAASAADRGFDAVTAYGYSNTNDFTYQKKAMEDAKANCLTKGIDFIPALMPCQDQVAWRPRAGYEYTGEAFEGQLSWAKDTILSGYTPAKAGGQKIIHLATWDEYGEGHILAPTEGNGFKYLDAVRNVMTAGGVHEDTVPTDAQKSRICELYRSDRVVNNIYFEKNDNVPINYKVYYDKVERDVRNEIPNKEVKVWDFKNADDAAKVVATYSRKADGSYDDSEPLATVRRQSDGIRVSMSGFANGSISAAPTIMISDIEDIDIHDVTHLKIRMKKNTSATMGYVSWTSNFYENTSMGRAVSFDMYSGNSTQFTDYYAPVYQSAAWAGKLRSLDITLGKITDLSSDFVVDSVALLADETIDNKDKVITEDQTAILEKGFAEKSNQLMIPINTVGKILGADSIDVYGSEGRFIVKYGKVISEFTIGSTVAKAGGLTVNLDVAPYQAADTVSGTVYIPSELFDDIFYNIETDHDAGKKALTAFHSKTSPAELIRTVEFDKAADLKSVNHVTLQSNSNDGYLALTTDTNDPQIQVNIGDQEAQSVKRIEIRLWSDKASTTEVFFKTDNDPSFNGSKRFAAAIQPGYNVISIDTSTVSKWQDTITGLRVDPATDAGVMIVVDSVSYAGEAGEGQNEEPNVPKISSAFAPIHTLYSGSEITVYGNLKNTYYAGKFVTALLLDKDTELGSIGANDIRTICQGMVEPNGKYELSFSCPEGVDPEDCKVYVRVGSEDISETAAEAFVSMNALVDFSSSAVISGNRVEMQINIEDEYGFPISEFEFIPIIAFYGENNALIGLATGPQAQGFSTEIPENTRIIKPFVWESLKKAMPLCRSLQIPVE